MKKLLWVVVAAGAISGCTTVNKQALTAVSGSELKGQTVVSTQRPLPDFSAMTPGKAAFAMVGAALMISEGNSIIAKNQVADPAGSIASSLMKELASAHGAQLAGQAVTVSGTDVGEVAEAARTSSRYVVDVQTINWSITYFPTDWGHYRLIYTAKARLIDAAGKKIIAEGSCKRIPESNANAPTYDELLANEAAVLKRELEIAAAECVKGLKSEMLAL